MKKLWQYRKIIVDVLGNKMGCLYKVTNKYFIAIDGTHYTREKYYILDKENKFVNIKNMRKRGEKNEEDKSEENNLLFETQASISG